MAVVMPSWFVRGRARPFRFGSPSMFTDRVLELQNSNAPSTRVVQWAETPDAHIFKLFQPGLKKEDLRIHIIFDRTLFIRFSNQPTAETVEEGQAVGEQKCSFMRKFKLPETADLEQIKAEVMNETLTVTIPKLKPKNWGPRKIDITGADATQ